MKTVEHIVNVILAIMGGTVLTCFISGMAFTFNSTKAIISLIIFTGCLYGILRVEGAEE